MTHAFLNTSRNVQEPQYCTKRPYLSNKDARRAMNSGLIGKRAGMVATGTGTMNVYKCPICKNAWHLGHK